MNSRLTMGRAVTMAVVMGLAGSLTVLGRGGGRGGGGGGGGGRGGGSFSRPSGGSVSRPSGGGGDFSRPSGGSPSRPAQLPSRGEANPGGGRVPARPQNKPSVGERPAGGGGSVAQLPSGNRPSGAERPAQKPSGGTGGANRPTQQPVQPGRGVAEGNRPGNKPAQRPSGGELNNFLGITGGAMASGALANRPAQLPANPSRTTQLPARGAQRPEQRPNWSDWSQNRDGQWQQRVGSRNDAWNNWQQKNQDRLGNFQSNQTQRWNNLQSAREDRQNWRDQNREDWQGHRNDLWDYRYNRADEIRSNARDFYDGYFDDRWWGRCRWGYGFGYVGFGSYPLNPWWWWAAAGWSSVGSFVTAIAPAPVYTDYGMTVVYEGDTVYVNNQPMPATQYNQPIMDMATNAEQPPPPAPPSEGQAAQWMPLGVFALAQEDKGDPIMFLQLSVNRDGVISGGYKSALTDDERPIAGQVDKATQRAAWRIGVNTDTIFETSLGNLTRDVSPVAIHFGATRTQTWLLVRMPEPAGAGQAAAIPDLDRTPPPLNSPKAPVK